MAENDKNACRRLPALTGVMVILAAAGALAVILLTIPMGPGMKAYEAAMNDIISLKAAIRSYSIDYSFYPAWTIVHEEKTNWPHEVDWPTFMRPMPADPRATLTTPVAYLDALPEDPFNRYSRMTYAYWNCRDGYLVWSPGPDRDSDIHYRELEELATTSYTRKWGSYRDITDVPAAVAYLQSHAYDPTNGAQSNGDIWSFLCHSIGHVSSF